jgi:glutaredoxin
MIRVTLFTKPGCHLCDIVKQTLSHVRKSHPFELEIRNILDNPSDEALYKNDIPVIHINGKEIARHRLTADAFQAALKLAT